MPGLLLLPLHTPQRTCAAPPRSRLTGRVKLVGPTISCEGSPFQGNVSAPWRRTPHVQSYALATDREGLELLAAEGVLGCHSDRWVAWWGALSGGGGGGRGMSYSACQALCLLRQLSRRWNENTHG